MLLQPKMSEFLSKHEIVFLSPPYDGWEGLPLGNGSFGGPLWVEPDGLLFAANHTDTWDMPAPDDTGATVLRSAGRLKMALALPGHEYIYLRDFEARLSLHRAEASFRTHSSFGEFQTVAYLHAERPVAVFHVRNRYEGPLEGEGAPMRLVLDRWGSRVFAGWYGGIEPQSPRDLGETQATEQQGDACLESTFEGCGVALRCRVLGPEAQVRVNHSRQVEISVPAAGEQQFTILLACVTDHESDDPLRDAGLTLDAAAAAADLDGEHRRWWAAYWDRSFLHTTHDYYENLYYLHLYLMGSSSRGKYPPPFNGALWVWNRDVRNSGVPMVWNQQQAFWCLPGANRADLLRPMLDTYHRLIPQAMASTRRRGYQGMIWTDCHDWAGRQLGEQSSSFRDNHTPAVQIGMLYWWHYLATGDLDCLRDKGYPFLTALGDFYLGWVQWKSEEQRYELPLASTYEEERPLRFTDTVTNLAMLRALLPVLIRTSELLGRDAEKRERWQHLLDHLPPYRYNTRLPQHGTILASGLENGKYLPSREDHAHGPLLCPIHPAGDIGLKDAGSELFEVARNTLAAYSGWICIVPAIAAAARLGMTERAQRDLEATVRGIQHFCNGTFYNLEHWNYLSRRLEQERVVVAGEGLNAFAPLQRDYTEDRACRYDNLGPTRYHYEAPDDYRVGTPTWPFIQMGMESIGVFALGLQEMLMQGHGGVIRVFPAWPREWEGAFTLLAEGGFLVSSRRPVRGEPEWIEVHSRRGGECAVVAPWSGELLLRAGAEPVAFGREGELISWPTQAGQTYLLCPAQAEAPGPVTYGGEPNAGPKTFHEATLGKFRDYRG